MQMVFSRSHRLATLLLLCCVVCCTVWVGVNAQGNCACSCCIGYGCTPSNAGQTTASSCDQDACNSAFPGQCPGTGESGACLASSISSTASSSYTSASGTITLDTSSVSDACKNANSGIDYQCGKSYSVAVNGSSLTLTSTSGPGSTGGTCDIGTGTILSNGASADGTFQDSGDSVVSTNEGDYISVLVDGECTGNYYVTSGGPILGVSKEASSGSLSFATVPFVALFGLAIMAVAILA